MHNKAAYPWRLARRIILFVLSLVVSVSILLVLPLHQYFSKGSSDNNNSSVSARVTSTTVNLEKPPPKKKPLKLETTKPNLSRNTEKFKRFNLNLEAGSGGGMSIASSDVDGLVYESSSVDELPVRLRGRDPRAPDSFYVAGVPGYVELEVVIEANGDVTGVSVLSESPKGFGLGQICADAVRSWSFRPAKVQGIDVRIRVVQPFAF